MKNISILFFVFLSVIFLSCQEETLPKPQGYLRLEYPFPQYEDIDINCPFTFGKMFILLQKVKIVVILCWSIQT